MEQIGQRRVGRLPVEVGSGPEAGHQRSEVPDKDPARAATKAAAVPARGASRATAKGDEAAERSESHVNLGEGDRRFGEAEGERGAQG